MKRTKLGFLLTSVILFAACSQESAEESVKDSAGSADVAPTVGQVVADPLVVEIVPGLMMRIMREGNGAVAAVGQVVTVHYTGWLYDAEAENARGQKFDSSVDRDQHFEFPLGAGRVIKGWDSGVAGMKVGEIRELTIAPEMAYGERGAGSIIGPGSTLVFEVELAGLSGGEPQEEAAN